ncbi:MAG: UDP-N-acetylmuramoyl-L-alanyl-D-glutamate--2,6-diaminopimelate ligase [Prevotellaceae bacterium]|jgi:UDP-N-acetylmuramoyl-L-alanyl-D-glutamate--2,6-diaminopimelate ligase|nr:UDP-N-acetylmuramoyl-L-alanyl-D-glutamate--2,6-diaminopimelate ligase [Prevotellaceae bacterium]
MRLTDILKKVDTLKIEGNADVEILSLGIDSRSAKAGQLFFAIHGTQVDGHKFISAAIKAGAVAVVCEHLPENTDPSICYVKVADSNRALGLVAAEFFGNPSDKLTLVGVTGTNGKTTTTTLLHHLFTKAGYKAGLLSTVVNLIGEEKIEATHTTPDAIHINSLLNDMVTKGCSYCFMEISSHAIVQERIVGLTFAGGAFTNITHDHLDYHKTFDEYIKAKKTFFDLLPKNAFALTNADDRNGMVMVQNTSAVVKTYALKSMADHKCRIIESSFDGMHLNIDNVDVWTEFIGEFNAYNLLAAYAVARLLGLDKEEDLRILSSMKPVSGRFECVRSASGVVAIIDYAHTPDALINVLNTINKIRQGNEKLIAVAGCGGNRDKTKRPVMAAMAAENSDTAILTSDNPRFEDPNTILEDMKVGLSKELKSKSLFITDRREAIRTAVTMAQPRDIILIAGKGHEPYQEINGIRHHFDDKEEVIIAFKEKEEE